MLEGIKMITPVYGDKTCLCEFRLEKGSKVPNHSHPYEQTGYMVSGRMNFTIGDQTFVAEPGTSWNIPINLEHGVEVIEDSVVIEVFAPVREDYLP
jgi:quercetin dioxygenase-like cupin family protein